MKQSERITHFPFRRLAMDCRYALVFNVLCALVVTFLLGTDHGFVDNLVASMCIGMLAFLLIDGVRLALWDESRRPPWLPFTLLVIVAVPVAQMAGMSLFGLLMGIDGPRLGLIGSSKMLGTWMFTLLATAGGVLFFSSRDKIARLEVAAAEEKTRAEAIARQALQAQLHMLQAQIEPHMLFNTLANLQGLIGFDPQRAQLLLDHLIQYLRATLSSSRAEATTLGRECALMEAYLGLMAIRMGQRLSYTIDLPDALRDTALPPMLLQPLVENAIQHGLEPKIEGGHLTVSARREGQALVLTVSDGGLGLHHPHQSRQGGQVGLSNIRARLHALHGARASLSLFDGQPCGAIAELTLPLTTP
ncbi:sensor histidine kinase YesM [Oxalobacteraceae bacterium GrIS 1.11]